VENRPGLFEAGAATFSTPVQAPVPDPTENFHTVPFTPTVPNSPFELPPLTTEVLASTIPQTDPATMTTHPPPAHTTIHVGNPPYFGMPPSLVSGTPSQDVSSNQAQLAAAQSSLEAYANSVFGNPVSSILANPALNGETPLFTSDQGHSHRSASMGIVLGALYGLIAFAAM